MILTFALLLGSAVVIYLSCELFVNGIEWVGRKLGVGETATGAILAAFGTALPESVVTLVATAFAVSAAERQIGVGAALGGPLALSTIAYAVVGVTLWLCARKRGAGSNPAVQADGRRLSRDQGWFLFIFAFKIGLGLVAFAFKPWLGVVFLAAYGVYVWAGLRDRDDGEAKEAPEALRLRPKDTDPHLGWALAQTLTALVVIFAASRVFVSQLDHVGPWLGMSPQLTAMLFSPIATELPETMNAVIWVRQGKERLALANISGAMMIQATVPTAFCLFFTPWLLDRGLLIGAAVTALATIGLFALFRSGRAKALILAQVGWLYGLFAALLAWAG